MIKEKCKRTLDCTCWNCYLVTHGIGIGNGASQKEKTRMGLFSGIKEAKARNSSEWLAAGHYICRIDRVKVDTNRGGDTGFFVEMTVLKVLARAPGEWDCKTHHAGASVTHLISKKFPDTFLPNIKAFVASIMAMKPEAITEADVDLIVSDQNPLSGLAVEYSGRMIKTKKNNDFTEISYRGRVPATRLKDLLDDEIKKLYYDGGDLIEKLIVWEAQQAGAQAPAAPAAPVDPPIYEDPPF